MTQPSITATVAAIAISIATLSCSSGPDPENPTRLWLDLAGSETAVRLVTEQPDYF